MIRSKLKIQYGAQLGNYKAAYGSFQTKICLSHRKNFSILSDCKLLCNWLEQKFPSRLLSQLGGFLSKFKKEAFDQICCRYFFPDDFRGLLFTLRRQQSFSVDAERKQGAFFSCYETFRSWSSSFIKLEILSRFSCGFGLFMLTFIFRNLRRVCFFFSIGKNC